LIATGAAFVTYHPKETVMLIKLTNSQGLAALRIAVGILFIIFGQFKVFGTEFTSGGVFLHSIHSFLDDGVAYPFMIEVLKTFVLPRGAFFAFLVSYGELAIGLSLISGILVRTASVFGAIYMAALILSANYPGPQVPLWRYFGFSTEHSGYLLCFLTFAVSDSACMWSIPASNWWFSRKKATTSMQ
jgi:uncharacterized membrane protein YphA (DoxX/SURF4 family)